MKCGRTNCTRKARRNNTLCNFHYDAKRREREARGGRKCGRTPAEPVLEHMRKLKSRGLGNRRIAELSGLNAQSIQRIKRQPQVSVDTAHRVLSIPVPATPHGLAADSAKVPLLGSARRLQAMNWLGWSNRVLAERLGVSDTQVYKWVNQHQPFIYAEKARDVDALFGVLQLTPAPSSTAAKRVRLRSVRNGWVGPMAWDDIDADAAPDLGVEGSFWDLVEDGRALGKTDAQLARIAGLKLDSFHQRLRRERVA